MRLAVIGTGHVGLITCVTMAASGHEVVGTDADEQKIALISGGIAPFYEPGLEELLVEGLASGRLRFTSRAEDALPGAQAVFISVGTPPRATGEANLIAVEAAATTAARLATDRCVIVEKSTVPTGTAQMIRRTMARERPDLAGDLEVASNPEFLREGSAVRDALEPDRIVVGAEVEWAFEVLRSVYEPFTASGAELIETDIASAELAKHACNAFLALKISFANALARISERSGADVGLVTKVMGRDERIGASFLKAGLGFGGSCFPKDLQAFQRLAEDLGYDFPMLSEVVRINEEAVDAALHKIKSALWNVEGKKIALLGLSFKPGTDDIRFSPALNLATKLIEAGAVVVGFDPLAGPASQAELPDLQLAPDPYGACDSAHCVVVCTEWDEICELDLARVAELVAYPILVDGRNVFEREQVEKFGFSYYPMGRAVTEEGSAARATSV